MYMIILTHTIYSSDAGDGGVGGDGPFLLLSAPPEPPVTKETRPEALEEGRPIPL